MFVTFQESKWISETHQGLQVNSEFHIEWKYSLPYLHSFYLNVGLILKANACKQILLIQGISDPGTLYRRGVHITKILNIGPTGKI